MIQKFLSFIFILFRSCSLRLKRAYVVTHSECEDVPNVKGDVYLNAKHVKFGKNVSLFQGVYFWGYNIIVGSNVDIGINTIIYSKKNVTIGDNTVIGAGSVVTKDIPSNVVAVGNPCKVLREIGEHDKEYYFRNRKIDYKDL